MFVNTYKPENFVKIILKLFENFKKATERADGCAVV
jgi:hypothetical protein